MENVFTDIYGINVLTQDLIEKGKKHCDSNRKTLVRYGVFYSVLSLVLLILGIIFSYTRSLCLGIGLALLVPIGILFIIAFTEFSTRNYLKQGIRLYKLENKIKDVRNSSVQLLKSDKTITLLEEPETYFYMNLEGNFQLYLNNSYTKIYNITDLLDYEIKDNQTVLINKKIVIRSRNIIPSVAKEKGKASIEHNYSLVLKFNDLSNPIINVKLESEEVADEISAMILMLIQTDNNLSFDIEDDVTKEKQTQNNVSAAEEIRKYKELLDDGIITQEEFDAKKKQLLGL